VPAQLHNIIKTYLLPGQEMYISPGGSLLPMPELDPAKNSAIRALHDAAVKVLDEHFFEKFLVSPEVCPPPISDHRTAA
jgi:hypothetical protein